jgi:hypothetical protein
MHGAQLVLIVLPKYVAVNNVETRFLAENGNLPGKP